MESRALTPADLFDGLVTFEIPPFQRPYVWNEEDQWQPLWDDIERLADVHAGERTARQAARHFLGAVVLKQVNAPAGDPTRRSVIDGQQRLTTLQLLLSAACQVMAEWDLPNRAEGLKELTCNGAKRFAKTNKRHKLWPSRVDRDEFASVMDGQQSAGKGSGTGRLAKAHGFFLVQIQQWARAGGNSTEEAAARLERLADVLHAGLQIVTINLDESDDDQLIFETINDRGTPLLAADLIKNHIFQRCEDVGAPVDEWADVLWGDFDEDWWRKQVAQGRLYRSRIDIFLQYWLTMVRKDEIPTEEVFRRFKEYSTTRLSDIDSAKAFLEELREDANRFRNLAELDGASPAGTFVNRVVISLELGAFTPVVLWMLRGTVEADVVRLGLGALESWAVRRTLLRRTMKDINKLVVALLKELDRHSVAEAGRVVVRFLAEQTSDARLWPDDRALLQELPPMRVYGSIKQQRIRTVLSAIEEHRRGALGDDTTVSSGLQIEHVMPQAWRSHWNSGLATEDEQSRDALLDTLGNLTLVTAKLNRELSNRPWTDEETKARQLGGEFPGRGKQWLLNHFSHLTITSHGVTDQGDWNNSLILKRSEDLTKSVIALWPRQGTGQEGSGAV